MILSGTKKRSECLNAAYILTAVSICLSLLLLDLVWVLWWGWWGWIWAWLALRPSSKGLGLMTEIKRPPEAAICYSARLFMFIQYIGLDKFIDKPCPHIRNPQTRDTGNVTIMHVQRKLLFRHLIHPGHSLSFLGGGWKINILVPVLVLVSVKECVTVWEHVY